ncbi:MAG: DNA-processing protein DprA [Bacteroidales bacterium]|nr:DNA-processing protein DprA [Bacteroidales bacterium]
MNNYNDIIAAIALTRIPGLGVTGIKHLLDNVPSASYVFEQKEHLTEIIPDVSLRLVQALDCLEAFKFAEAEYEFAERHRIACIPIHDSRYPMRLRDCPDAPSILFYRGNVDLNAPKVISVVGTRKATAYGQDLCASFIEQLSELFPDAIIVSGLAYGTDINAHRAALKCGMPTIGVLAHGLDRIYPASHRTTAKDMLEQGGLLTEYPSGTNPDRQNFVQRNRIVAGMSDATVVIESALKGGAMITARLANDYHHDCFTFPGRVTDKYSEGCNQLIRNNEATLITSTDDFLKSMDWSCGPKTVHKPKLQSLFPELSADEALVVKILENNLEGVQINTLSVQANMSVHRLSAILFSLEIKGVVKAMAGATYRIIQ